MVNKWWFDLYKKICLLVLTFALGWVCSSASSTYFSNAFTEPNSYINHELKLSYMGQDPAKTDEDSTYGKKLSPIIDSLIGKDSEDVPSPHDWIKESQIKVYNNRVIIDLENVEWAAFTDTNSMDPVIDSTANAIEIIPKSEEDIHIGDIVSYNSEYADGTIIHRVIKKEKDEEGVYFIMKGDNNPRQDPGKVRFNQIERVLVAIIY